jgi:hypothetical protein
MADVEHRYKEYYTREVEHQRRARECVTVEARERFLALAEQYRTFAEALENEVPWPRDVKD